MHMRAILATVALAAATLISGAATAAADDAPFAVPDAPVLMCGTSGTLFADCGNN
ncbi:hypothetical protein ABZY36_02690 [Streptomyces sp. NPDC006627]|uniref:hypothetical protein n=1 Tax=Streptomyces sp. NPDC006627 TaxID=3154679 RepID=UPI0033B78596